MGLWAGPAPEGWRRDIRRPAARGWKGAVRFESWAPGKGDFEGLHLLKGLEVRDNSSVEERHRTRVGALKEMKWKADGTQALR